MSKNKKFQMPGNIRNKLMGAVSMLLVSSILMVSTTYAWFTLSTAPEVTGITTSVGANGNLEIALLTTETYTNTNEITSAVGDSSAATGNVTVSNITWGNLVDLSATSYGLDKINLMPARLNVASTGTITTTSILKTATYGADGRVNTLAANTVSGVLSGSAWDATNATYGVRAIGTAANLSAREMAYNSAKGAFTSQKAAANSATSAAIGSNSDTLLGLVSNHSTINYSQMQGINDIANGMKSDLQTIVNAYKNYLIAAAAAKNGEGQISDEDFETAKTTIEAADASTLADYAPTVIGDSITIRLDLVASAQTSVNNAITGIATLLGAEGVNSDTTWDSEQTATIITALLGEGVAHTGSTPGSVYMTGGALAEIANNTGNFELASAIGTTVYAGAENTTAALPAAVPAASVAFSAGGSNITDTYGYALDFAFRTNAATSNLMLQTAGANRVYSGETNADLATQGAGSYMTFTSSTAFSANDVKALMGAIRVVFVDGDNIKGVATLDTEHATTAANGSDTDVTAKLYLHEWSLSSDQSEPTNLNKNGAMVIGDKKATQSITALTQNTVEKITVIVYLDGDQVNNANVANAVKSMSGKMNLQFSSSATLTPMQNTALKTMTTGS